ncbi:MAG: hypothetical protein R3328_01520 [Planococcaceae bacterium]|nr:hypothetical protein [Planococcaceae bacterium]
MKEEITSFKDSTSIYHHKTEIDKLVEIEVINGFTDNTLLPEITIRLTTIDSGCLCFNSDHRLHFPPLLNDFKEVGMNNAY